MIGHKTFEEFNDDFYSRVEDLAIFDCGDFNLLKVVLDGLKVDYLKKGKWSMWFFKSTPLYVIITFLKRLKSNYLRPEIPRGKKVLIYASARTIQINNEVLSVYYNKIINFYGRENAYVVYEGDVNSNLDCDCIVKKNGLYTDIPSVSDLRLRNDILRTLHRIKESLIFSDYELRNISAAIMVFYSQYQFFNRLISDKSFTVAHIDNHYHKEGFILALKRNNVVVHELQHGIISSKDIFYVFPEKVNPIKNKTLFPDFISVYGEHWKNILLEGSEFDEGQVSILGNYLTFNEELLPSEMDKIDVVRFKYILVCTQTYMSKPYGDYIKFLADYLEKNKPNHKIIVKHHPLEKETWTHYDVEAYRSLHAMGNVIFLTSGINSLLKIAEKHISIYSTTLFDALAYDVENYCLSYVGSEDYVSEILKHGIGVKLEMNEVPFDMLCHEKGKLNISNYYCELDFTAISHYKMEL